MDRKQLIKSYIEFFKSKGHKEIANSSLVPENDPTVLFTTAGMHPLVPFLLGQKHLQGKRLVNVQRCIRTGDIDSVGDAYHHTFFEMLGNWSLGDYWKKEAIEMTFEFHTKILKIPAEKYAVTCFAGNKTIPKDEESEKIWKSLGIKKEKIAFLGDDNFWQLPGAGPCGPCTEQFYWTGKEKASKKFNPEDKKWVEIGNDVLMQYEKDEKGNYKLASQKNIDFGGGVERTLAVLSGLDDNYLTDCFFPIIKKIEEISGKKYKENEREMRIIADHIKAAVFIIAEGVTPSNVERGYVLRRLIRRAIRYGKMIGLENFTSKVAEPVFEIYDDYKILKDKNKILTVLIEEEIKFMKTLEDGLIQAEKIFSKKVPIETEKFDKLMKDPNKADLIGRIFDKKREGRDYSLKDPKLSTQEIDKATITAQDSFLLFQSYGFPLEMIDELAMAKGLLISHKDFRLEMQKHQELSRTASAGQFKSGLADNSEKTAKLHTATHLLNQALREVLKSPDLHQKGSNITPERLRFDFNFDHKLTPEELKKVEDLVNKKIQAKLPVICEEMPLEKAKKLAHGVFEEKYGDKVKVYTMGDFSKEICAGPHVNNTSELGKLKILKEESSSAGVRRIKAELLSPA